MHRHRPVFSCAAGLAGGLACLLAGAGPATAASASLDQLVAHNPFVPAGRDGAAPDPARNGTGDRLRDSFTFRGLARVDGSFAFSLYNNERKEAAWFALRSAGEWGIEVLAFDPEGVAVTVAQAGDTARLVIEEARPLRELSVGMRLTGGIDPKRSVPDWSATQPPPAPPAVADTRLKPPGEAPVLPEAVRRRAAALIEARRAREALANPSGSGNGPPPALTGRPLRATPSSGADSGPATGREPGRAAGDPGDGPAPTGVTVPPARTPGAPPSEPPPLPPGLSSVEGN